jgi:hypothetical protein
MTFNQTIGLTIVTLIIAGHAWLARSDRRAFRTVTPISFTLILFIGMLAAAYTSGHQTGKYDQIRLDDAASDRREKQIREAIEEHTMTVLKGTNLSDLTVVAIKNPWIPFAAERDIASSPIPTWAWLLLALCWFGISALAVVEPLLNKVHADTKSANRPNDEVREDKS